LKYIYLIFSLLIFSGCFVFRKKVDTTLVDKQNKELFLATFSEANHNLLLDNNSKAIELFNKCIEINTNSAASYYQLSKIYVSKNDLQQALFYSEKSVELSPDNLWYLDNYADILIKNNETDKAFSKHKELLQKNNDTVWIYNISQKYSEITKYQYSLDILNFYDLQFEDSLFLHKKLFLQKKLNLLNEEQLTLNKLILNYPNLIDFKIDLIYFDLKNNFTENASIELDKLDKNSDEYYFFNAYLSVLKANCDNLIYSMQNGFNSGYISKEIKQELLNLYLKNNLNCFSETELSNIYKSLFLYYPNDESIILSYLTLLKSQNKTSEIIIALKDIENKNITDFSLINLIANIYLDNLLFSDLLSFSVKNIDIYPNKPELYLYTGISAYNLNDTKKAKNYLTTGKNLIIDNKELLSQFNLYLSKLQ